MLLLFETPAGHALFKVLDEGKLDKVDDLYKSFETPEAAAKVVKLAAFDKFENTAAALGAATALVESKLSKGLRKFIKEHCKGETLAIADSKLGNIVKEKLNVNCVHNATIMELFRGIRSQLTELVGGLGDQDLAPMSLGLSHSLSRYKLKFSPDKVDTMIVQAIGLLDDLDKELNTYAMRVREWYGWHFPEMGKVVADNIQYAKSVKFMGLRSTAADLDFSGILEEEVEATLKEAAVISMGTEISPQDLANIIMLCDQVISLSEYRAQLYDYLRSRMNAIAPNLTVLVGELVGARLIAHAGSLIQLAKQPASTVQILGAEKALFRALKTKHETPKYGLIYHASLIGQAPPKYKGKISRILAAKCALSIRVDALGESADATIGIENRQKVETRLRQLEGKAGGRVTIGNKSASKYDAERKPDAPALLTAAKTYNPAADSTLAASTQKPDTDGKKKKKKKDASADEAEAAEVEAPKTKKAKQEPEEEEAVAGPSENGEKKKKKKKERYFETNGEADAEGSEEPSKKKKKRKAESEEGEGASEVSEKKKKKKKKDAEEA